MPKEEHLAFRQNYSDIAKQLTTAVHVSPVSTSNPDFLDKRFQRERLDQLDQIS
jgi:hypothetical protein